MWVICFYLNANKKAFSETVIRGCGRGGGGWGKEMLSFLCSPALLSQQLVRRVPLCEVPSARLRKLMPQAASSCKPWHCTFNLANVQIKERTCKAPRFLFKFKKK